MHTPEPDLPRPAQVPSITDYWPDLPQRLGPPADYFHSGETPARPAPARPPAPRPGPEPLPGLPESRPGLPESRPGLSEARPGLPESRGLPGPRSGLPGPRSGLPGPRPGLAEPLIPADAPRRGRFLALLSVVGLLAAAGLAAGVFAVRRGDGPPVAPAPPSAAAPPAAAPADQAGSAPVAASAEPATASTPAGDLRTADFVLASDAAEVKLRTGALDGDLYRITAPGGSGVRPSVTVKDGTVRLILVETGRRGPSRVDIVLSAAVRWGLRVDGGLSAGDFDLSGIRVSQVRLAGDAADLRLVMPAPDGTVAVRVTGGINRLRLSVPGRTPMRIRARGGGGQVDLDGRTVRGVARNTAFETDGWRAGRDRLDVDATSGFGALRAERRKA